MRQLLIPPSEITQDLAKLNEQNLHHLVHVLRKKEGDLVDFTNGYGIFFKGKLIKIGEDFYLQIKTQQDQNKKAISIALGTAILKGPHMDWLIEKVTELGVEALIPFVTEHTVVRLSPDENEKKLKRWKKIAEAALKQCGRSVLPQIGPIMSFDAWLESFREENSSDSFLKVIFAPGALGTLADLEDLTKSLKSAKIWVGAIGPEGDFSPKELERAEKAGFLRFSLGENILRAETAAIAATTLLRFFRDGLSKEI